MVNLDYDYLGKILSYCPEKRRISLNMKKYTVACIEEFKKENLIKNLKCFATPATSNLFQIRKECERELLEKERKSSFHLAVAKLLFLSKRGRPDILLAVSFLTTRVLGF
jgi:hypothetical protein